MKSLMLLFSLVSLAVLAVGTYYHDASASFGLVLLMTSLICNVAIYLSPGSALSSKVQ